LKTRQKTGISRRAAVSVIAFGAAMMTNAHEVADVLDSPTYGGGLAPVGCGGYTRRQITLSRMQTL
jgi:hypothetical protein